MQTMAPHPWFTRILGSVALVLAVLSLFDLFFVPVPQSHKEIFGVIVGGPSAKMATIGYLLFYLWLTWGCFRRRRAAGIMAMVYAVYVVISLWVFTALYGSVFYAGHMGTAILTNIAVSIFLLAFCRYAWQRRSAFDR